jgi:hypothetical protein
VPDTYVPKEGMHFHDVEDAYEFYCDYGFMSGFPIKKSRKRPQVSWFMCSREGKWESKSVEKKTEKGSIRIGCKAEVKLKLDTKGGCWYFDKVVLTHNHVLTPQPRMVRYMRAHTVMEDGVKNLMNMMTGAGVQHQSHVNVMSELHGGRDNWAFTERDFRNRFFVCSCNCSSFPP